MDYEKLLKDRGLEREYHKATLTYKDTAGSEVAIELKVMARGSHRRDPSICRFPPIMLNFSRKTAQSNVFGHANKLKLVTHCLGDDYVLREYLAYKVYNIITGESFRVRLCRVEYVDVNGKRKTERKYAFLIEDDNEMARRNKGTIVPKEKWVGMESTDTRAMARVAFFQYMIGNTDWSVSYRHNIKLISRDSLKAPTPVPYDFDYSGIVAPPYAVPPPELGITSVRQRLFRGYPYSDEIYSEVIRAFNKHKAEVYKLYLNCEPLDNNYRRQALGFFDNFYETVNDQKDFNTKIVRVAQQNRKSYVVVKGLK